MLTFFRRDFTQYVSCLLALVMFLHPILHAAERTGGYDGNADGFGDIWQSRYRVPPFGLSTEEDEDFDGFSNLDEALAGTNPYSPGSSMEVTVQRLAGGENRVSWPAQPANRYQLEVSTDQENWYPWGQPVLAASTSVSINVPPAGGPRIFFKVRVVESLDADGDGLTDWEEGVIGTDPALADTDADGVNDGNEQRHATNPLLAASVPPRFVILGGDRQTLAAAEWSDGTSFRTLRELLTVQLLDGVGKPWSGKTVRFSADPPPGGGTAPQTHGFREEKVITNSWPVPGGDMDSITTVTDAFGMTSVTFRTLHTGTSTVTASLDGGGAVPARFTLYADPPPVPAPEIITGLAHGGHCVTDAPGAAVLRLPEAGLSAIIHYTLDGSHPSSRSPVYESSRPIILDRNMTVRAAAVENGRWSAVASLQVDVPRVRVRTGHSSSVCYLAGNRISSAAPAPLGPSADGNRIPIPLSGPDGYLDAAVGSKHGVAVGLQDGGLLTWGAESFGEKGDGPGGGSNAQGLVHIMSPATPASRFVKAGAGQYHSVALDTQGRLWGWGRAPENGHSANKDIPTLIPGLPRVVDAAAGLDFTAVVGIDGEVYFFGNLSRLAGGAAGGHPSTGVIYKLLRDTATGVPPAKFVRISAGSGHLAASDELARHWFFGRNDFGQCGFDPDTVPQVGRLRVNTVLDPRRTTMLKASGERTFFTTGRSHDFGDSTLTGFFGGNPGIAGWPAKLHQPAELTGFESVGGTPGCIVWTDALGVALAVGTERSDAGGNAISQTKAPRGAYAGVSADLVCDQVSVPGAVDQLAASTNDSFFVLRDGRLFGFGENSGAQLGTGPPLTDRFNDPVEISPPAGHGAFVRIATGLRHTLAVTPSSTIYSWGQGDKFQLGQGTSEVASLTPLPAGTFNPPEWARKHKLITAGDDFSVVTAGSEGRAAGVNTSEQCRQTASARTALSVFSSVVNTGGEFRPAPVTFLSAGRSHVAVLLDSSSGWLQAWGDNRVHQISPLPVSSSATPLVTETWMAAFPESLRE